MAGETVVGVFDRAVLSSVLIRLHQQRLGSQVRVLDAARAPLATQLSRAGLALEPGPAAAALGDQAALVVIGAPGRHDDIARLLRDLGAQSVSIHRPIKRPALTWTTGRDRPAPHQTDPSLLHSADTATAETGHSS